MLVFVLVALAVAQVFASPSNESAALVGLGCVFVTVARVVQASGHVFRLHVASTSSHVLERARSEQKESTGHQD